MSSGPRRFLVGYRLRLAELRGGWVARRFSAVADRCFVTDELNIILADIYAEVGPAPICWASRFCAFAA